MSGVWLRRGHPGRGYAAVWVLLLVWPACVAGVASRIEVVGPPSGVAVGSLALVPLTLSDIPPGLRTRVAETLEARIRDRAPGARIVGPAAAERILAGRGLGPRIAELLRDHDSTGIIDRAGLGAIGEALGTGHLLRVRLAYRDTDIVANGLHGVSVESRQEVDVLAQLWEVGSGDVVWEASGPVSSETGDFVVARDREDVMNRAIESLVAVLPFRD